MFLYKLYVLIRCMFDMKYANEYNICKNINEEVVQINLLYQIGMGDIKFHLEISSDEFGITDYNYLSDRGLICYAIETERGKNAEAALKFGNDWYHIDGDPMLICQKEIVNHIVKYCKPTEV